MHVGSGYIVIRAEERSGLAVIREHPQQAEGVIPATNGYARRRRDPNRHVVDLPATHRQRRAQSRGVEVSPLRALEEGITIGARNRQGGRSHPPLQGDLNAVIDGVHRVRAEGYTRAIVEGLAVLPGSRHTILPNARGLVGAPLYRIKRNLRFAREGYLPFGDGYLASIVDLAIQQEGYRALLAREDDRPGDGRSVGERDIRSRSYRAGGAIGEGYRSGDGFRAKLPHFEGGSGIHRDLCAPEGGSVRNRQCATLHRDMPGAGVGAGEDDGRNARPDLGGFTLRTREGERHGEGALGHGRCQAPAVEHHTQRSRASAPKRRRGRLQRALFREGERERVAGIHGDKSADAKSQDRIPGDRHIRRASIPIHPESGEFHPPACEGKGSCTCSRIVTKEQEAVVGVSRARAGERPARLGITPGVRRGLQVILTDIGDRIARLNEDIVVGIIRSLRVRAIPEGKGQLRIGEHTRLHHGVITPKGAQRLGINREDRGGDVVEVRRDSAILAESQRCSATDHVAQAIVVEDLLEARDQLGRDERYPCAGEIGRQVCHLRRVEDVECRAAIICHVERQPPRAPHHHAVGFESCREGQRGFHVADERESVPGAVLPRLARTLEHQIFKLVGARRREGVGEGLRLGDSRCLRGFQDLNRCQPGIVHAIGRNRERDLGGRVG